MSKYFIPVLFLLIFAFAIIKKVKPYDAFTMGAKSAIPYAVNIFPYLASIFVMTELFEASGLSTFISGLVAPAFSFFGIPPETAILVLIRPFSGSAALAIGTELMMEHGVDSIIGRTAAIMLGTTETTFYTISVYFGAAGIQKTRYTIPAALVADFTGFFMASLTTKFL